MGTQPLPRLGELDDFFLVYLISRHAGRWRCPRIVSRAEMRMAT
jgi:hypothetical protein